MARKLSGRIINTGNSVSMAGERDLTLKKWNIVKEQLISLSALNRATKSNECINSVLSEDVSLKNLNSSTLIAICYFLLGIINAEERNKLVKWPLTNIQSHTKFRKGLSTMVTNFQEQYPWANLKKLPESYFVDPHGCEKKLVDFILRLTNLAIHIALNDPELLVMHSGCGLNSKDVEIMSEIISNATHQEEKLIKENILPLEEFEAVKNDVSDKCIALRQENNELEQRISNLIKCAVSENFIPSEKSGIEGLKTVKEEKLSELNKINNEFLKYHSVSKELLSKLKALKNPVTLSAKDFNLSQNSSNLAESTMRVCKNLHQLHENIVSASNTKEEEENFYRQLMLTKTALEKENEALKLFLSKMSALEQ